MVITNKVKKDLLSLFINIDNIIQLSYNYNDVYFD